MELQTEAEDWDNAPSTENTDEEEDDADEERDASYGYVCWVCPERPGMSMMSMLML